MIKREQKELADYVKQVHLSLRRKSREIGAEKAWEQHLKNEKMLKNYSIAMKKLAEDYWSINNNEKSDVFLCRIQWVIGYIIEYFQKGLLEKEVEREKKKLDLFVKKEAVRPEEISRDFKEKFDAPYKLLDVGSCYNPFGKFNFLEVYPVDLYPASPEVKKCNFLEVEITNFAPEGWFEDDLRQIQSDFFDVVVFSLFLEYLPSAKQRYVAVVKAYKSLKTNGILLIVTPDSKHASANAKLMKNWKIAAAGIGFVRTRLEKLKYLYCMAFRKSTSLCYSLKLNNIKKEESEHKELFIIPQDSVDYKLEGNIRAEKSEGEEDVMREFFGELPFA